MKIGPLELVLVIQKGNQGFKDSDIIEFSLNPPVFALRRTQKFGAEHVHIPSNMSSITAFFYCTGDGANEMGRSA